MQGEEEDEEEEDPYQLPISHEVTMGGAHAKAVMCLDVDHSGSRMLTGGQWGWRAWGAWSTAGVGC